MGKIVYLMKGTLRKLLTVIARLESPPDILFHGFCFGVTEKYVYSMPHGVPERQKKARLSVISARLAGVWFGHATSTITAAWQLLKTGNSSIRLYTAELPC